MDECLNSLSDVNKRIININSSYKFLKSNIYAYQHYIKLTFNNNLINQHLEQKTSLLQTSLCV